MGRLAQCFAAILFLARLLVAGAVLAADTDGDGVDDSVDNSLIDHNPSQEDADGDGCGNRCDADYDQTGDVSMADLAFHRDAWEAFEPAPHSAVKAATLGQPISENWIAHVSVPLPRRRVYG
jgi:hypothetical protein